VVANIEQEYSDYVCSVWQEITDVSKDNLEPDQEIELMYNAISSASNQFLRKKLKVLDIEKDPFYTD
jgi:hypothetical protein